ncbi:hypothetical protein ACEPAF_1271 [Sanghuangporus sanghuang]
MRFKKLPVADWDYSLPVEILEIIFEIALKTVHLGDVVSIMKDRNRTIQPLLRKWARVCRGWYVVVTPMIYCEAYMSSPRALAAFARAVTKYPYLRPLVHSFHYYGSMFESGMIEMSQVEVWNVNRVYRACTNLNAFTARRPLAMFPSVDSEVLSNIGLDSARLIELTRLEIVLPDGVPCDTRLIFSSDLILPALQELTLDVQGTEVLPDEAHKRVLPWAFLKERMEWPCMPQLTRLCIKNWHAVHGHFNLPQHSNRIRILELLGGDYSTIEQLFGLVLMDYRHTLECVIITAFRVNDPGFYSDRVNLSPYTSIVELCIPLTAIRATRTYSLPCRLEKLILAGCPEKNYEETDEAILQRVEKGLDYALLHKTSYGYLWRLKEIHLMVRSPLLQQPNPAITFGEVKWKARLKGVTFKIGLLRGRESE